MRESNWESHYTFTIHNSAFHTQAHKNGSTPLQLNTHIHTHTHTHPSTWASSTTVWERIQSSISNSQFQPEVLPPFRVQIYEVGVAGIPVVGRVAGRVVEFLICTWGEKPFLGWSLTWNTFHSWGRSSKAASPRCDQDIPKWLIAVVSQRHSCPALMYRHKQKGLGETGDNK